MPLRLQLAPRACSGKPAGSLWPAGSLTMLRDPSLPLLAAAAVAFCLPLLATAADAPPAAAATAPAAPAGTVAASATNTSDLERPRGAHGSGGAQGQAWGTPANPPPLLLLLLCCPIFYFFLARVRSIARACSQVSGVFTRSGAVNCNRYSLWGCAAHCARRAQRAFEAAREPTTPRAALAVRRVLPTRPSLAPSTPAGQAPPRPSCCLHT